jgi:hypothetical protein
MGYQMIMYLPRAKRKYARKLRRINTCGKKFSSPKQSRMKKKLQKFNLLQLCNHSLIHILNFNGASPLQLNHIPKPVTKNVFQSGILFASTYSINCLK